MNYDYTPRQLTDEEFPSRPAHGLFKGMREARLSNSCVSCDAVNVKFRDELSLREYDISVLCQKCQDSVFGGE